MTRPAELTAPRITLQSNPSWQPAAAQLVDQPEQPAAAQLVDRPKQAATAELVDLLALAWAGFP